MLVLLATIAISAKFEGGILYLGLVQLLRRLRSLAKGSEEAFEAVLPSNPAQFVERLTNRANGFHLRKTSTASSSARAWSCMTRPMTRAMRSK